MTSQGLQGAELAAAVDAAISAGDLSGAADLVDQAAKTFSTDAWLPHLPSAQLQRWLTVLGPIASERPWLLYYQAAVAAALRRQALAAVTLDRAAQAFTAQDPGPDRDRGLTMVALARANIAERDGRYADARAAFEQARALLGSAAATLQPFVTADEAARWRSVDPAGATAFWLDAAMTYHAAADAHGLGRALHNLATFALRRGEPSASRRLAAEAVRLKSAGSTPGASLCRSLNALGMAERMLGAAQAAADDLEEARAIGLADGNPMIAAYALCNLAELYADLGEREAAEAAFATSCAEKESLGDEYALAYGWRCWAQARRLAGDAPGALALARRAWATRAPCPDPVERAELLGELGAALVAAGEQVEGVGLLRTAVDTARGCDAKATLAAALLDTATSDAIHEGLALRDAWQLAYLEPEVRRARGTGMPAVPRLTAQLIGEFQIFVDGKELDARHWRNRRAAALLRCLVLHRHRPPTQEQLLEWLWPDSGPAGASSLSTALSLVRRNLVALGASRDVLWRDGNRIRLGPLAATDLDAFETTLAAAARARTAGRLELAASRLDAALAPWRTGDLLPGDCYASWADAERDRLATITARARADLVDLLLELGRPDDAVAPAHEAIAADRLSEHTHRLLIKVHLARGDELAARDALRNCRRALAELGQQPSRMTERLVT